MCRIASYPTSTSIKPNNGQKNDERTVIGQNGTQRQFVVWHIQLEFIWIDKTVFGFDIVELIAGENDSVHLLRWTIHGVSLLLFNPTSKMNWHSTEWCMIQFMARNFCLRRKRMLSYAEFRVKWMAKSGNNRIIRRNSYARGKCGRELKCDIFFSSTRRVYVSLDKPS